MPLTVPIMPIADSLNRQDGHRDAPKLRALLDRSLDTAKGYESMVDKAEPAFRPTAEHFRALHVRHADNLARMLLELGVGEPADGTLMGTVNQAVVTFRSIFDTIDADVMDQVRNGEKWVLEAFDDAIAERIAPTTALQDMRNDLTSLLAETQHLG